MKIAWVAVAAAVLGCSKAQLPVEPPRTPTPTAAALKVTAITPEGAMIEQAEVFIDGEKMGATPYLDDQLAVGNHSLRLVKSGFRVYVEDVQFEASKQYIVEAVMQPLGPTQGELFVTVDQESPRLQIMDFSQTVISQTTSRETALLLSPGGYFVSAEKAGYNKSLVAVAVKAGEATVVNIQMQASGSAPLSPAIILSMPDSARTAANFTVRWSSINATRVDVDFVTNPGLQGAAQLQFAQVGWHFVRAAAYNESLSSTTVDSIYIYDSVTPPPPSPTISLTSNPDTIKVGQKVNLTWRSTNATMVNVDYVSQASLNGSAQVQFDIVGTYTISATAYGLGGQQSIQTTVVVREVTPATTITLTSTPDTITVGQKVSITWRSTNATMVTVDYVSQASLNGSTQVQFDNAGTFAISATAYGLGGQASAQTAVVVKEVVPTTTTITLTSTPDTITVGQKVSITWRSTNATMVNIDYVSQPSLNGSAQVQFDIPGTFTIHGTAEGSGGQATAQTKVVVKEVAPITMTLSFTASPDSIEFGKMALLRWQTNGSYMIIDHGVGTRGPAGEEEIGFASPGLKTVTATAYGPSNLTIARQARVYVKEAPQPLQPMIMLSVTSKVDVNSPATIAWYSQNADHVVVDYLGTVAASGSAEKSFTSPGTRFITATAYNSSGYASATDTVEVVSQHVDETVADIIVPADAMVRADKGEEGYNKLNAATVEISKAGYYRITAEAWFNSGDDQKNESFYILVRHTNGTTSSPRDGNAGVYMVVEDEAGAPHTSTRDCGAFYLDAGTNNIDMHHYAKIASLYPQFVNGHITGAESVTSLGFKLVYVGN